MNRRILVIDDEPQMRLAMCRVLEKAGYVVEEAGDGAPNHRGLGGATSGSLSFNGVLHLVGKVDGGSFHAIHNAIHCHVTSEYLPITHPLFKTLPVN